jgi:CO/xanthine dehydrogenase FAD-binding subunit
MVQGTWRISADASLQAVLEDPACPPLLSRVLGTIRSWQVRNETTVNRTLTSSRLMPHWTAALLALDAVVTLEGDDGSQDVALESLVRRQKKGKATSVRVQRREDLRWGDAHVGRTPSDDPIVAAYAAVWGTNGVIDDARIVLSGASSEPVWMADVADALVGRPLDGESVQEAVSAVMDEAEPAGDYLGSEAYRRAMAGVLTRRALEACVEQEEGDE